VGCPIFLFFTFSSLSSASCHVMSLNEQYHQHSLNSKRQNFYSENHAVTDESLLPFVWNTSCQENV